MAAAPGPTWKGFRVEDLKRRFQVGTTGRGFVVPYLTESGGLYREKLIPRRGKDMQWLGESKPQHPYGLETLRLGGLVAILAEGESDCWALRIAFPHMPIIGLPGASTWKPEWAAHLSRFLVVYMSFDGDDAGRRLVNAVWPDLGSRARWVRTPNGYDTRDVLQSYGLDVYTAMLRDADHGAAVRAWFKARGWRDGRFKEIEAEAGTLNRAIDAWFHGDAPRRLGEDGQAGSRAERVPVRLLEGHAGTAEGSR